MPQPRTTLVTWQRILSEATSLTARTRITSEDASRAIVTLLEEDEPKAHIHLSALGNMWSLEGWTTTDAGLEAKLRELSDLPPLNPCPHE